MLNTVLNNTFPVLVYLSILHVRACVLSVRAPEIEKKITFKLFYIKFNFCSGRS